MSANERQPLVGLALRDPYPWPDLAGLVRWAERAGFGAVFLPEVGARDTLGALAALAGETSEMLLATGVVPIPARSPTLLAMAAATVQERSGGRLVLGLGTGPTMPGALDRLRDVVAALRIAFAGGTGVVAGSPVSASLPLAAPPRIWIAALGPRATRLAGEIADGVLLNWCPPSRLAEARSQLAEGASAAGRRAEDVTVGVYVRAALTEGSLVTAEAMAAEYASYPSYRRQFVSMGIDPRDARSIVRAVMLTDPATAREQLEAYRAAGADLPVVYPVLPQGSPDAEVSLGMLEAVAPNLG
jgi:alkanesulfonate monooxygenase SsuD/methylene tetrahydromethanopterin reductase-like flavin-dependent oxidoreductase (luciferase family)